MGESEQTPKSNQYHHHDPIPWNLAFFLVSSNRKKQKQTHTLLTLERRIGFFHVCVVATKKTVCEEKAYTNEMIEKAKEQLKLSKTFFALFFPYSFFVFISCSQ